MLILVVRLSNILTTDSRLDVTFSRTSGEMSVVGITDEMIGFCVLQALRAISSIFAANIVSLRF